MKKLRKFLQFIFILSVGLALLFLSPFLIALGVIILLGCIAYAVMEEVEENKNKESE